MCIEANTMAPAFKKKKELYVQVNWQEEARLKSVFLDPGYRMGF